MYKNISYGNSAAGYNIKDTATALKRQELDAAFFLTIPGPKMIWQFGEIGYDYSINYCQNGSINNNCRTDPKPIRWDYLQQTNRKKLFDVYSALIRLRYNPLYKDAFVSNTSSQSLSGPFKWIQLTSTPSKIVVMGNFDVASQTSTVTFPSPGTWYDYLNGTTITATGSAQSFTLSPGEYHVYLSLNVALPVTIINFSGRKETNGNILTWDVASEINLRDYELQKSTDGQNFSAIQEINATGKSTYSYTDEEANNLAPIVYYRLKSVDINGKFNFSSIVSIKSGATEWSARVNPNPVDKTLKLHIQSPIADKGTLLITDLTGRKMLRQTLVINPGNNSFEIYDSAKFGKGVYLLSILASQKTQTIKVIKNN